VEAVRTPTYPAKRADVWGTRYMVLQSLGGRGRGIPGLEKREPWGTPGFSSANI